MANSFDDTLRLTAERLRSERERIQAEHAKIAAAERERAKAYNANKTIWQQKVQKRIEGAIATANAIIGEVQIQATFASAGHVDVSQKDVKEPAKPVRRSIPAKPAQRPPRLRLTLDSDSNVSIQKRDYKHAPAQYQERIPFKDFQLETVEELIADFVNSGLLGFAPVVEAIPSIVSNEAPVATENIAPPHLAQTRRADILLSVRSNQASIKLTGASFLSLVDARIEQLEGKKPNSEEAMADWNQEVAIFREMKSSASALLDAVDAFVLDASRDGEAVAATFSFKDGINKWWEKSHVDICDKGLDTGLFTLGLTLCYLAGATGDISAVVSATVVKGKPIVDAIKALMGSKGENGK